MADLGNERAIRRVKEFDILSGVILLQLQLQQIRFGQSVVC